MLSQEQETLIEQQQFSALKNIYGLEYLHRILLELSGIEILKERRIKTTYAFAQKAANNWRFQSWFPRRRRTGRKKHQEEYIEMNARKDKQKIIQSFTTEEY